MKRKEDLIILFLLFFLLCGYTFPANAPHVKVNCSLGNNTLIYFAENQIDNLEVTEYAITNKSSSNIYGYSGNTRIIFPTYDEPYYNNGYNSINLSITSVVENNLYTYTTTINKYYEKYMIILLGGLFVWILFKLKR